MSASLVGSEMCIRDSGCPRPARGCNAALKRLPLTPALQRGRSGEASGALHIAHARPPRKHEERGSHELTRPRAD
eukprot:3349113-Alexandrium_andersonii.AAC.1